jgi:formylglycine-generating enzyme required for sulfatase activity
MKRCPYCDEEVRDNAVKCKHCGSMLGGTDRDTLDRAVTLGDPDSGPQYDTLDAEATQDREAATLASQYRIVKKIGEGGMGVVYLAEDMEMGSRPVAIKVLPPLLARNIRAVENLRKEAITAICLNRPNIIRLHGFHSDGDIKFLVMEYVDGQTLEEKLVCSERGRMGLEEVLPIAEQIADALDYAHNQKPPVFHRDLKPSNIMIDKSGQVKLLDFGIAREMKDSYTRVTGQETSGTVPYMSPQQINGDAPNPAMDIYSLGVTVYECLSGHTPFYTGDLKHQILNKRPPEIADIPEHVNAALQAALAKNIEDRSVDATALIGMLKEPQAVDGRIDEGLPEAEVPPSASGPRGQFQLAKIVAILAIVVAVVGYVGISALMKKEPRKRVLEEATQERAFRDVVPVKGVAEKAWDDLQNIDQAEGFGQLLDDARAVMANAQSLFAQKSYVDAKSRYEDAIAKCENIKTRDEQRRAVAAQAQREAEKSLSQARTKVQAHPPEYTELDKLSYIIGTQVAFSIKKADIEVDPNSLESGLKDAMTGARLAMSEDEMTRVYSDWQQRMRARQASKGAKEIVERTEGEPETDLSKEGWKVSYIIGTQIAQNMRKQDVEVNLEPLISGFKDALAGRELAMSQTAMRTVYDAWLPRWKQEQAAEKAKMASENLAKGTVFLEANKTKEGVKVLPSGLQYKVIREGTGKIPVATDKVKTHYRGRLIDGTEFDSSYKRGHPAEFSVIDVIKGWVEALQLMKEGAKWEVYIPADLAYGARERPGIPANSTLVFEIELLEIIKPAGAKANTTREPNPGDVRTNSTGMKLVYIPAGSFMMGSSHSAARLAREYSTRADWYAHEHPQHQVRISKGFWMGQTEVTQAQYKSVMNAQPWSGKDYVQQSDSNPAVNVSWNDAAAFCRKLSQQESITYRLPTEAEWEYACRAGTTTRFSFGDSDSYLGDHDWFSSNAHKAGQEYAHSVGQKKPNPWGLYDMHGNVREWCSDWYDEDYYSNSPSVDPKGPSSGSYHVFRGVSWNTLRWGCRSAARGWPDPDKITTHMPRTGFRVVVLDF